MTPASDNEIVILGAGGFGREMVWAVRSDRSNRHSVLGLVDDKHAGRRIDGLPVWSLADFLGSHRDVPLLASIGDPFVRRRVVETVIERGGRFSSFVHDTVRLAPSVRIGDGSLVCAGCTPTVDIDLGRHVHINLHCTLGHDVSIGDFTTLAPGVHVSGTVRIGCDVFIGTGATIVHGLPGRPVRIGRGSIVGAGACVTGDLEPDTLYVGVPARAVRRLHRRTS